jgi:hypothetical protein
MLRVRWSRTPRLRSWVAEVAAVSSRTVDRDTEEALRLLEEVVRSVPEHEVVQLDDEYLRLIAAVEALPENQDGADKAHTMRQLRALQDLYRRARRL